VAQNICEVVPEKVFDETRLEDEMHYDMEWSDMGTGEVGGKVLEVNVLEE
jgi:hypothetical protein